MGRHPWALTPMVEDVTISLGVREFHRAGTFASPPGSSGRVSWTDARGIALGAVDYHVANSGLTGLAIQLYERGVWLDSQYVLLERQLISVATTRPFLGGQRFWFLCPVVQNGKRCHRRVGRLYLPRGRQIFVPLRLSPVPLPSGARGLDCALAICSFHVGRARPVSTPSRCRRCRSNPHRCPTHLARRRHADVHGIERARRVHRL